MWIYDYGLRWDDRLDLDAGEVRERLAEALAAVWHGEIENDRFNRLVLAAGLRAREITVLRAYANYLRQTGTTFSRAFMATTLAANPEIARLLVELVWTRFDPDLADGVDRELGTKQLVADINRAVDAVASLNEDRVLRSLLALVMATVRTNLFQVAADGRPKPWVAIKLNPREIPDLPLPRPRYEVFVYSPRTEGVHLRGGEVARGGLRWSDRPEDFRTEILGLMKAQQVKNAVIVPVGAKGGFVVKAPPAGREALQAEAVACYSTFIRGLLDVTDNLVDGAVLPPPRVVRHDGDDPYLVVAADKGTATFSDIANAISREYGFWLGDAFASGGSHGYDHKAMGITARGAWVSVRRHFHALGIDVQEEPVTVVGVGDMSGDVFGNGMLLSRRIRLVAAFDHRHVFLDPDPDPERSFAERSRLFALPRSSWADYDPALISTGGGVYPRTAKAVSLSPEVQAALAVDAIALAPDELIRAILRAPVDLLWNGGIGTYVKASTETNADVGDKNNDGVRVDADELRCRVVGEGGNLGLTQRGRIEYALRGGQRQHRRHRQRGRCRLLGPRGEHQDPARPRRARRRPHRQAARRAARRHDRRCRGPGARTQRPPDPRALHLRRAGRLDARRPPALHRRAGALRAAGPGPRAAADGRSARRAPRVQPGSRCPSWPCSWPTARSRSSASCWTRTCPRTRSCATSSTATSRTPCATGSRPRSPSTRSAGRSSRPGSRPVSSTRPARASRSGWPRRPAGAPPTSCAPTTPPGRSSDSRSCWAQIRSLDGLVPTALQIELFLEVRRVVERASRWLLRNRPHPLDVAGDRRVLLAGGPEARRAAAGAADRGRRAGAGRDASVVGWMRGCRRQLASRAAALPATLAALDITQVADAARCPLAHAAAVHFELGAQLRLDWLRQRILELPREDRWEALARGALRDTLHTVHASLAADVLATGESGTSGQDQVRRWLGRTEATTNRCVRILDEVAGTGRADLATLTVAVREIGALAQAGESA